MRTVPTSIVAMTAAMTSLVLGCSLDFKPTPAPTPTYQPRIPDGVVCDSQVCLGNDVCCINPPKDVECVYASSMPVPVNWFGACFQPEGGTCLQFLACDGPEDCPSGTNCCQDSNGSTGCEVPTPPMPYAWASACFGWQSLVCHTDSDCGGSAERCEASDAGAGIDISVCSGG